MPRLSFDTEEFKRDVESGMNRKDLAEKYKVGLSTIYKRIKLIQEKENSNKSVSKSNSPDSSEKTSDSQSNESETESSSTSSEDSLIEKLRKPEENIEYTEIKSNKSIIEEESEEDLPPPPPLIRTSPVIPENYNPQPIFSIPTQTEPILIQKSPVIDKLSIEDAEYTKKKELIITIRKYCEAFWTDKLEHVIRKNKQVFYDSLSDLTIKKLQITLDNIRYEISLRKLNVNAENLVKTGAMVAEKIISMAYDISGTVEELWLDEDFRDDLKLVLCEIEIEKVINPKSALLLRIVRIAYVRNQLNKVNKNVESMVSQKVPSDFLDKYKKI